MANQQNLHPFWKHTLVTFGLCLALFPILPLIYLVGLAAYYSGKTTWKNRARVGSATFGWIPWKLVAVYLLSALTGVVLFGCIYGRIEHEQVVREKKEGEMFILVTLSVPVWLAVFYGPGIRRRWNQKREAELAQVGRERESMEITCQETRQAESSRKEGTARSLSDLETSRRQLLGLYMQWKPYLDDAEWDESTFIDFDRQKQRIRDGWQAEVFSELQSLEHAMRRDAAIGELKLRYKQWKPIIEADISARMFASLIAGIPKESPDGVQAACEQIHNLLTASHQRHGPAHEALHEDERLDSLAAALEHNDPEQIPGIIPAKDFKIRRTSGE